jgi:hypothetical protein
MAELTPAMELEHLDRGYTIFGREITYRQTANTFNKQTGVITPSDTDTVITLAIIGNVSQRTVANSGGRYRIDDLTFRVRTNDLPEAPPKSIDKVVFGSVVHSVIGYNRSQNGQEYDLICRDN